MVDPQEAEPAWNCSTWIRWHSGRTVGETGRALAVGLSFICGGGFWVWAFCVMISAFENQSTAINIQKRWEFWGIRENQYGNPSTNEAGLLLKYLRESQGTALKPNPAWHHQTWSQACKTWATYKPDLQWARNNQCLSAHLQVDLTLARDTSL